MPMAILHHAADDAYIKYADSPYTYYDGANDYDFRTNALGEILYGQDAIIANFRQFDIVLSVAEYQATLVSIASAVTTTISSVVR